MKVGLERYYPRLDHLWPLIILAGLGFYTSLVPLPPNDFWWHLKIGELVSTTRLIPTTNMFAWTLLAVVAFGLVGYEARRRSGSWQLTGFLFLNKIDKGDIGVA